MKTLHIFRWIGCLLISFFCMLLIVPPETSMAQNALFSKDVKSWYVGWANDPDSLGVYFDSTWTQEQKDSLDAAIQRWNTAGCVPKFKQVNSPDDAHITITRAPEPLGCAGECVTSRRNHDDKVVSAEITISPDHNSPPNPVSLTEVVTHELGHALGLKDTDENANPGDVMKALGTNGTDGHLSKHDSLEMRQAAENITYFGEDKPDHRYAIFPDKAIMPGEYSILTFILPNFYPPGSIVMVEPLHNDMVFVEMAMLYDNFLEVGLFTLPDHYSGMIYLNIHTLTPDNEEYQCIGIHYINQFPAPHIAFDCPFNIMEYEGRYLIDWEAFHTYPFVNPLRATLVVDETIFYEVKPNGNFLIDLAPGEHILELFVDDYQVNNAYHSMVFFATQAILINVVSDYEPYPGEKLRVYGEHFGEFTPECAVEINGMIYHDAITYWSDNEVFFTLPYHPPGEAILRIMKNPVEWSNPVELFIVQPETAYFILPNEDAIVSENIVHLYAAAEIYQELIQSASFYFRPVDAPDWDFIGTDLDGANQHYSTSGPLGSGDGWSVYWDASSIDEMAIELKVEMTDIFGHVLTGFRSVTIDKEPLVPFINFDASKLFGGKAIDDDELIFEIEILDEDLVNVEFWWVPPIPGPGGWYYERELEPVGQYSITFVDDNNRDIRDAACGPCAMTSCLKWLSEKYPESQIAKKSKEELAKELAKDAETDTAGTRDDNLEAAVKKMLDNDPVTKDKFEVQRHLNHQSGRNRPSHNVYDDIARGLRDSSDVVMLILQLDENGDTLGHYVTASSHHTTISYHTTDIYCAAVQTSYVDFMDPSTGETEYKIINWYDNPPQIQDYDLDTTASGNAWVQSVITIKPKKEEKAAPKDLMIAQFTAPGPGSYQFAIPSTAFVTGVNIVEIFGVDSYGNKAGTFVTCAVGAYQPIANFTADKQTVTTGMPVQFTDVSNPKDSISNWQWDFGDGMTSDEQNPQHIYNIEGQFTVQLVVSDGVLFDTIVRENYISVGPPPVQQVDLIQGWSGISAYIAPDNPDLETIFAPVVDELIILYGLYGMYWPALNINTLNNWDTYSGYVAKVTDDVTLTLTGQDVSSNTINLSQGWNLIPVFNQMSASAVLSTLPGFVVAKGIANAEILWPAYNINTMPVLKLGSAYYVYTTQAGSITYAKGGEEILWEAPEMISLTPWNKLSPSPNTHLVAFTTESLKQLQKGDMVAAFTQTGRCAGAAIISDIENPAALILNGNDLTTIKNLGFAEGEPISLKRYHEITGEIFDLEVTWDNNLNHSGCFEVNGLSAVIDLKMSGAAISQSAQQQLSIYPNPTKGKFTISGLPGDCEITIFNAHGNEILNKSLTLPAEIDLSAQPASVYFISIKNHKQVLIEKLIKN